MHISSLGGTKVQIVLTYLSLTTASTRVSDDGGGTGPPPAAARGRFFGVVGAFLKLHSK